MEKLETFKKALQVKNEQIQNLETQIEGYKSKLKNIEENPFSEKVEDAINELDAMIK